MARPFQTRSGHWRVAVGQCVEVTKEGCTAPGWLTEQGKALALGSGRISCQNSEVASLGYQLRLKGLAKANPFRFILLCVSVCGGPYLLMDRMATTAEMQAFVGDGHFAGDGGATLQRLWCVCSLYAPVCELIYWPVLCMSCCSLWLRLCLSV